MTTTPFQDLVVVGSHDRVERVGEDELLLSLENAVPVSSLRPSTPRPRFFSFPLHQLRLDWTNLDVLSSPFTRAIQTHQTNCSLPLGDFRFRNRYGLGSDLHVWTQALCNGMQDGYRIRTEMPWAFWDESACGTTSLLSNGDSSGTDSNATVPPPPPTSSSALLCYFPHSELLCPGDRESLLSNNNNRTKLYRGNGNVGKGCEQLREQHNVTISDVRASGIEYLFANTGPIVVQEAQKQLHQLLGASMEASTNADATPQSPPSLPTRLITVHIRWGDKKKEMRLRPIKEYVQAVLDLTQQPPLSFASTPPSKSTSTIPSSVGVFLATEDPQAVHEFQEAAKWHNWTVYVDPYFREFESTRDPTYNGNPRMSQKLRGRPGLVALASLLVALQANEFVLTTNSNWSRLINELRKTVLESRCRGCTRVVDLSPGEW